MKLLIGIATYKRITKLKRLIESLKNQTYQDFFIHVVCDNLDLDTAEFIKSTYPEIIVDVQPSHKYVIGAWNLCVQSNIDKKWNGFIGLCDDVELKPDTLQKSVEFHKDRFVDGDGVIGFNQECPGHPEYTFKWFGQTLMGRKFINRYKDVDYKICCPHFQFLYQDEEMYEYASSLDKFYPCKQAILYHYHPGFVKEEIDDTHNITRQGEFSPKQNDIKLYKQRKRDNKTWGLSWEK